MLTLDVRSPFDGSLLGTLPLDDEQSAHLKMDRVARGFSEASRRLSKVQRIAVLKRFRKLMADNAEAIVREAVAEGGKPLRDSQVEMDRALDGVEVAIRELQMLAGREIPMGITPSSEGRLAFTRHVPKGPVLAISAFNHPINLFVHQVIPAVAAGCPVVFKPSLKTPLSGMALTKLLYEAGLPEERLQVVVCPDVVTQKLVSHPQLAMLSFIGSARVGWHLRSLLAPGAGCVLEHGGVAPAIIDDTADLEKAVRALVRGAFYHAGQVCVSVQRIFVHNHVKDEFLERFVAQTLALKTGDPHRPDTDVGPLIRNEETHRISQWVDEAKQEGASVACGARSLSDCLYSPTVLIDPPAKSLVSREEIFGPVACVYGFENRLEAYAAANSLEYAFQSCVFTESLEVSFEALKALESLAVMVNDHSAFRVDWMPFGGCRSSGLGVGGIGPSIRDLMHEKLCVINQNERA